MLLVKIISRKKENKFSDFINKRLPAVYRRLFRSISPAIFFVYCNFLATLELVC